MSQTKKKAVPERWRPNAKLTIIAALLLAHWSSAGAADNHDHAKPARSDFTDLPLENLMNIEVQSASRFKQTIGEAPSAVSVVSAADIKTFGWRSLAEILRSLPGVYTSNDRTYTSVAGRDISRPGDYNLRYLLMIDGNRVNDPLYDQAMMGQEFMLDVDLIERVEYVPGPGSAVYGTNAFFGVINVITKRGRDISGVQVSGEGGSARMQRERATLGGKGESGVEWLLSATNFNRDGKDLRFSAFPGQVARGLDYERVQSVFAKGTAGAFSFSFVHAERKKGTPTAEYGQNFNDPRSGFVDTNSYLNMGYSKALSDKTELSARVFYNRTQYSGRYIYGAGGADDVDHDGSSANWWGGDAKLVSAAIHGHKLVTGVEFQKNQSVRQWNYNLTPAPDYSLNRRDGNYRIGLYLQDEWTLRSDLLLSAGMRYDYNSRTVDTSNINPRLGLIYKLTPQTTAKLLFGKAFRLPNFYEMYYSDSESQLANAKLQPERIISVEAILEQQWASSSHARLSVFRNKVRNLITGVTYDPLTDPDPASNSTATPGSDTTQFRNIGSATALGVQAELQKTWSDGSRLRTSLSWQKATDDDTGATLVNAPKWLGKANLSMPFYNNLWRAGAEAQYVATRNTKSSRLGGYTLANLNLFSDRLIKGADVSVGVYNLLNRKFSEPVGADFTQDAIPQDGRNFRVKLSYNF